LTASDNCVVCQLGSAFSTRGNEASRRIAEKLGFCFEGIQRKANVLPDGQNADRHCYARFDVAGLPDLEVQWRAITIKTEPISLGEDQHHRLVSSRLLSVDAFRPMRSLRDRGCAGKEALGSSQICEISQQPFDRPVGNISEPDF